MDKSKLENIIFKIIEFGLYLTMFTPLIFIRDYFFPFVVPKTIFFRILVNLIFIGYIFLVLLNQKYWPKINLLNLAVITFVFVLFLTSLTGINFARSFWSVFERMTGLLTFLHLLVFYIVLVSVFQERKYWERILSVSVFVAALVSFYAFFSKDNSMRGGGTLGNSSFLMSYLLFNIFFASILFWRKSGVWRIPYVLAIILFLILLFFNPVTITKGAVSSFAIGFVLLCSSYMFFSGNNLLKKLSLVFLVIMVFLGFFIVKNFHFKDRPFNLIDIPDRSRQIVWGIGWQAWQEKFLFGWGWENFNVPFAKYYNPELPLTGDIWYDRVHNIILDIGVGSGLIGLVSYLFIFFVVFFGLIRWMRKILMQDQKKDIIIPLTMMTLFLVYFLQNFWVFDMISSYIMFFISLAFVSFLIYSPESIANFRKLPLPVLVGVLLIFLSVFVFFYGNIRPAISSRVIFYGLASPLRESISAFQKSLKFSSMAQFEVPERFAFRMADFTQSPNQNRQLLLLGFQKAADEFEKALLKNKEDMRMNLFLGNHYISFYKLTGDSSKLNLAQERIGKALKLSPRNQQVYFSLAQLKLFQGLPEEALQVLEKAKDLEPNYEQASLYLERTKEILKELDSSR